MDTREFAIMIINGEVYTGEFHSQILNKYLKDYNAMLSNSIKRFKPNSIIPRKHRSYSGIPKLIRKNINII